MPDSIGASRRRALAQRRKAVGLTQEQLAEQLGVDRTTVVRWERGETQPQPWMRPRLAKALRVSADRLGELLAIGTSQQRRPADVPRQLPAAVADFTGRAAELQVLTKILDAASADAPGTMVIAGIGGTAGVGKTALAVHWAHQVAARFPDGQLYVNLRGYDPDQPVPAAHALAGFLRALGVPGQDIPADEDERAARYRSLLAGRQALIVLDNAASAEQARPLLPGTRGCAVVVTSRDALVGLVARDGARRLDVDLLPLDDALALLRTLVGARIDAEPDAAVSMAHQCARLPLALRVAAELAVGRPAENLIDLVRELGDEQQRLDLLDVDRDPRTAVRAVFSWSYRSLDPAARRVFRLAGVHPGPDVEPYAISALADTDVQAVAGALQALARAHLVQVTGQDQYGTHDLLRAYARELAAAHDADDSCHQALTRLFDYYRSAAAAAMDLLFPVEAHLRPRVPPSAVAPAMPGQAGARAWLDRERVNLVAVVVHCAGHGWPRHATSLARTLFRYLMSGSYLPEAQTIYSHALQAARLSGDPAAEAQALNGLGGMSMMKGHFHEAAAYYQVALQRYRECGDQAGQGRVLYNSGLTEQELHNHRSAADYYRQAIAAYEAAADSLGAARALTGLAGAENELGSYDLAEAHLQRALPVLRDARHDIGEAEALASIGWVNLRRGQLTQAADFYQQALSIYRRIEYPGVSAQLCNLGEVSLRRGEYRQALSYLRQALTLYRKAGDQQGEILALRSLAEALLGVGRPAAARKQLATAIQLAAETGNAYHEASAHRDLAENHHSAGEDEQAAHHWQQAVVLYDELDAPEASEVRARLAALAGGSAAGA